MTTKSVTTLMTTQKVVIQLGDHVMTTHDHTDHYIIPKDP